MSSKASRNKKILETVISFMKNINKWDDSMKNEIPHSYEKYGEHLLFFYPAFSNNHWNDAGEDLWKLICKLYNGKGIAIGGRIQDNKYRTPNVKLKFGDSTLVCYIDNHIKYSWDIEKNMFSAGNVTERHRIGSLNCDGKIIVDLFAGIGYFTLPYLVHAKAKFLHACEWNINAVNALRSNLEINGVANRCEIYFGDNREVAPRRVADIVNVGLIPSSQDYWQIACESLTDKGGILYIHENITSKFGNTISCSLCNNVTSTFNISEKLYSIFECYFEKDSYKWNQIKDNNNFIKCKQKEWFLFALHIAHSVVSILNNMHCKSWKSSVTEVFKVKSYAPHIDHIVYTVHCYPL